MVYVFRYHGVNSVSAVPSTAPPARRADTPRPDYSARRFILALVWTWETALPQMEHDLPTVHDGVVKCVYVGFSSRPSVWRILGLSVHGTPYGESENPPRSWAFFFSFHALWVVNLAAPLRACLRRWPWVGRALMECFPRKCLALPDRLTTGLLTFPRGRKQRLRKPRSWAGH